MYSYDPIGSLERVQAACTGAGASTIQPLLDELTNYEASPGLWHWDKRTQQLVSVGDSDKEGERKEMEVKEVCDYIRGCYTAAAERAVSIGDSLELCVITPTGVTHSSFQLHGVEKHS